MMMIIMMIPKSLSNITHTNGVISLLLPLIILLKAVATLLAALFRVE